MKKSLHSICSGHMENFPDEESNLFWHVLLPKPGPSRFPIDLKCFLENTKHDFEAYLLDLAGASIKALLGVLLRILGRMPRNLNQHTMIMGKDPTQNPSGPYYIHAGENPLMVMANPILIENNYHIWARSMKRSMISKNEEIHDL
ncbi:hypothetical protein VNO77_41935 [Canavalia gladiata]|uniref:Retrotransposon Copia-like N-terminal domain-containing protein n=1 Tax=Canavalia gladiata TaxID=3824 RepID=A0AAN9K0P8_CANGL